MCCPCECLPQISFSNESLEDDCVYDKCCSCSACRKPCPPRPCTPFPCPQRCPPPPPCSPCPPPRCPPRPCNPCPSLPCSPCPPCKVKGKFGLAYIVETPKNRCETPLGWQIEFEDTPSKISNSCKKMMQWVNCPPLGECGTDAVMSGYPKKCARTFAFNPKSCCYADEDPPPCDCCCRSKPQPKYCKPRRQRRKPCCPATQPNCCCGKQEARKRYEEPVCSCYNKSGNSAKREDDSLDYVPDKEVHYKNKNGRENQKKEQHRDSKYVQHDQSHLVNDEETANQERRTSSILSGQLEHSDVAFSASKNVLYSKHSLHGETNSKNGNQDLASSARINSLYSKDNVIGKSNSIQNMNQAPALSSSKDSVLGESNSKQNRNEVPVLSSEKVLYSQNGQDMEGNMTDSMNKDPASPSHISQTESEINIPLEDYNAFIKEGLLEGSPNDKVTKTDYKTLREKIRQARKQQEEVIHQEAEKMHDLEEKRKHEGATEGKGTKTSDIVGLKLLIEVKQSKKQIEQGIMMQHELEIIKKVSDTN